GRWGSAAPRRAAPEARSVGSSREVSMGRWRRIGGWIVGVRVAAVIVGRRLVGRARLLIGSGLVAQEVVVGVRQQPGRFLLRQRVGEAQLGRAVDFDRLRLVEE